VLVLKNDSLMGADRFDWIGVKDLYDETAWVSIWSVLKA